MKAESQPGRAEDQFKQQARRQYTRRRRPSRDRAAAVQAPKSDGVKDDSQPDRAEMRQRSKARCQYTRRR